jgi:PhnB protein
MDKMKETLDAALVASLPKQVLTLSIYVEDPAAARAFYAAALGAREVHVMEEVEGGELAHAQLVADAGAGGFQLYLGGGYGVSVPGVRAGESGAVSAYVVVPDCDKMVERMARAGGTVLRKCEDHFYGMRDGRVRDPYGCVWVFGQCL